MKNYQRLAQFYEVGGWGKFAEHYIGLIDRLLIEYGIKKARILDIACGTGILALALAKQGHSVHGIDISQEMIALARAKSSGIANVSFDVQSITDFKVKGEFDIVTCTFDSLNYLITFDVGIRRHFSATLRHFRLYRNDICVAELEALVYGGVAAGVLIGQLAGSRNAAVRAGHIQR